MPAYRWALEQDELTSPQKFVLIMLADHYNATWGRSWPSVSRLAKETALAQSTVSKALQALEDEGLIIVERWTDSSGVWLSNRYLLPRFAPRVKPAIEQPVMAWLREELDYESSIEIPGSPLAVEAQWDTWSSE